MLHCLQMSYHVQFSTSLQLLYMYLMLYVTHLSLYWSLSFNYFIPLYMLELITLCAEYSNQYAFKCLVFFFNSIPLQCVRYGPMYLHNVFYFLVHLTFISSCQCTMLVSVALIHHAFNASSADSRHVFERAWSCTTMLLALCHTSLR